jgi:NDP-sugar pyrophosphorylase family protein
MDETGTLSTFLGEERRVDPARAPRPVMFTGVQVLQPHFLDRIPDEGMQCVVRTAYRALFDEGRIHAHHTERYWWEHSTVERYLQGIANVLDGKVALPYAEQHLVGVHPTAKVHSSAEIRGPVWVGAGAEIGAGAKIGPYAQVGKGARVGEGVKVERSAVWDRAVAAEDRVGGVVV